ncbi:peptide/nickel transport system permease protein [Gemmobacter megaterium]|uniref:Peptide/nickel transport system permease protein n=1 Tax=Gemmobacter megaterium TaxID=1086013 RepID=A0A1N7NGP0_9RHOB|nr:ABC transporter permease [Gemmobacter megaterium]GGE15113.1 glutathione ABC transporter permease [Gemmobacter megaterium]SIS97514.1 peptide/nickel transport system permease protein [Gemmobacter megaterium]
MSAFLIRRLLQAAVSLLGVTALIFFLQRLTGDPVLLMVPEGATQEAVDALRRQLGFDRPVMAQFTDYMAGLMRLDFGQSIVQNVPVVDIVASRLPYTIRLAAASLVLALGMGVPLGVFMAVRRDHPLSRVGMGFVLAGQSLPTFWSGILLILVFAVWLGWLPSSGARQVSSVILPAICLSLLSMATFARVARTAVLDELSKPYVRAARAKGLPMARVVIRHVLRNGAIPVISIAALEIANLLSGAVIVETVFAWPGLGQLTMQSIAARDFPIVQAVVLLGAFVSIFLNLAADLLYSAVDPRIRLEGGK